MDQKRRTIEFEANPFFAVLRRIVTSLLIGAGIGFLTAQYILQGAPTTQREFVLWAAAALGALAGIVIAASSGLLGGSGRGPLWEVSAHKEVKSLSYTEIHQVRDGYQIGDRIFQERRDAEDYQRFVQAYQKDWKESIRYRDRHWAPWYGSEDEQKVEEKQREEGSANSR
jgi:hypothetical protein